MQRISLMIITINKIEKDIVKFSSEYGEAYGRWKDNLPPSLNKYGVELDYGGILNISQLKLSDIQIPRIKINEDFIEIIGKVIDVEEKCLTVQIGDSIIEFEICNDKKLQEINGKFIKINLPYINIYNENLIQLYIKWQIYLVKDEKNMK